ncbi:MAG: nuclear transport factor 2 family protein [Pseudomonadota bacterium]
MPDTVAPADLAKAYLRAMEARDLDAARAMLVEGFRMTFPGTAPMADFADLFDWAEPRYRQVVKTFEAVETLWQDDVAIVYVRGTLAGEWPDGDPFEGIRFLDRFEIRDGKIAWQDVWNDVAEMRPR